MRISVEPAHHLPVAVVEAAHTHAAFAFTRFTPHIRSVTVRMPATTRRRGGVDQRCSVAIRLTRQGEDILVEASDADPIAALSQAVTRAARAVARRLDRRDSWRRLSSTT
jgi:ribosome-associated translation inhibitor RaiA